MSRKFLFLDTETTGTDPIKNAMFQMSGIIEINGEIKDRFSFNMKPFEGAIIEESAMKVNKMTPEIINAYPPSSEIYKQFIAVLNKYVNKFDKNDKFFIVGYYVHFDSDFLRKFFEQNNDKYYGSYFWSNNIEVSTLAGLALVDERPALKNFRLSTVAQYIGIEHKEEETHDASVDIQITYDMFHKFMD